MTFEPPKPDYEGCDACVYSDDSTDICLLRRCIHAVSQMKECYVQKSTPPERLTDDDFETIRIHLNAHKEALCNLHMWKEAEEYQRIIDRIISFATEQVERRTNESNKR